MQVWQTHSSVKAYTARIHLSTQLLKRCELSRLNQRFWTAHYSEYTILGKRPS